MFFFEKQTTTTTTKRGVAGSIFFGIASRVESWTCLTRQHYHTSVSVSLFFVLVKGPPRVSPVSMCLCRGAKKTTTTSYNMYFQSKKHGRLWLTDCSHQNPTPTAELHQRKNQNWQTAPPVDQRLQRGSCKVVVAAHAYLFVGRDTTFSALAFFFFTQVRKKNLSSCQSKPNR